MYHSLMLLAGMLLLFYSPSLPTIAGLCLLALSSLVLYQSRLYCIRLLATLILAYGWAGADAIYNQANDLSKTLVNQSVLLSACIIRFKIHDSNYQRILIDVSQASQSGKAIAFKGKVSLSNYSAETDQYQKGWCGKLTARLKPVHGRLNQRGFDYEAWAYVEKIKATGSLQHLYKFEPGSDIYNRYLQFKSSLVSAISQTLEHTQSFELVISLALGERDLISTDVWAVLRQSGTSHLLAISGLHIGLVFWMMSTISTLIWRNSGWFSLVISAQKAGWLSGLAFAGGYLLLTGLPLSGRRAWVMLACCVGVWVFDKRIEFKHTLVFALWVILLLWPSAVLAIGFWFSYIAVALIISQFVHLNINFNSKPGLLNHRISQRIKDLVKIQCLLSVAISPLNVIYFGEISLISPLANLIAVPLVTFIILPVILTGTFLQLADYLVLSKPILVFAADCLDWLFSGLKLLSDLKGSLLMPKIDGSYSWYLLLIGIFVFNQYRAWPGRWVICLLLFQLMMSPKSKFQSAEFELNMFDVGQGLSIWVRTANRNILIDTGFGIDNGFSHFENTIYPVLKAHGVNKLDLLVLSHGDSDHAGGVNALLDSDIYINQIYTSKQLAQALGVFCDHRISWRWDDIKFSFLTQENVFGDNNQSCVLKVDSKFGSVLLPGDIEHESEIKLVRQYAHKLSAEILIVPHHGSSTSSTPHFLHYVSPKLAVVSAGYLNRYGHPTLKVVQRYKNRNVRLLDTACNGEISIVINQQGLTYSSLRQTSSPFWRHQC